MVHCYWLSRDHSNHRSRLWVLSPFKVSPVHTLASFGGGGPEGVRRCNGSEPSARTKMVMLVDPKSTSNFASLVTFLHNAFSILRHLKIELVTQN